MNRLNIALALGVLLVGVTSYMGQVDLLQADAAGIMELAGTPGAYEDVTFIWRMSPPGPWFVRVVADDDRAVQGVIAERDETNSIRWFRHYAGGNVVISGVVQDCLTGAGVADEEVRIREVPAYTTVTNRHGTYTLVAMLALPAEYTVEIRHPNYFSPRKKTTGLIQPPFEWPLQVGVNFAGVDCQPPKPTPVGPAVTPTPSTTRVPTLTSTPTLTTPAMTRTPTPTATRTPTPRATHTPTSTATSTPTATVSNTPTSTPTDTATATRTLTPTTTNTSTPTVMGTPTATHTSTPTVSTATATLTPTVTNTPTPTSTTAPTSTSTATGTSTVTPTPTGVGLPATESPTVTATSTLTGTPTVTNTPAPTSTATSTSTATATSTSTAPPTPTSTPTSTSVVLPATETATATVTSTSTPTLTSTPAAPGICKVGVELQVEGPRPGRIGRVPVTLGILGASNAPSVVCRNLVQASPSSVTCLTSKLPIDRRNVNFFAVDCFGGITVSVANQDILGNHLEVGRPSGVWDDCPNLSPNCIKVRFGQFENQGGVQPFKDLQWTVRLITAPTITPTPTRMALANRAVLREGVRALTIRAAPGVASPVRGYLFPDQVVAILGGPRRVGSNPWFEIRDLDTGVMGWINGDYLRGVSLPAEEAPATVVPAEGLQVGNRSWLRPGVRALSIRTGPGIDNPIVDYVWPGDVLLLKDGPQMVAGDPWYAILNEDRGVEGWVNGRYLVPWRNP